ncbi:MAG: GIY-YIG nuclease family protein, partial [Candidatus Eremiobacteraeota bacterium]|nr:GIY-YIG nuclease family protein [Candidatus Eremiobacteraeota bacterium]
MKTYWVYMLLCSDESFYTGVTNNVGLRLDQHNQGIDRNCYT